MDEMNVILTNEQLQRLQECAKAYQIDTQTLFSQAVDDYLDACEQQLNNQDSVDAGSKLSYDEFWDGVDI
ncbi:MAG: hypothetical protein ACQERK_03440 [Campylobacterota bacterium]